MKSENLAHLVEISEKTKTLSIYRVDGDHRQLFTEILLPEKSWSEDPDSFSQFCLRLGENIVLDSPVSRRHFRIDQK